MWNDNAPDAAPDSGPTDSRPPLPAPGAWRRYFARTLDLLLWGFVVGLAAGVLNTATGTHLLHFGGNRLVATTLAELSLLPIVLFIDAAVCAACGNSVGKALLGVRVTEPDGTRPSFRRYLRRNVSLWARGLAFGVPIARQLTMLISALTLSRGGTTAWDAALGFRVVRERCTVGHYAIAVALLVVLSAAGALANFPHRHPFRVVPLERNAVGIGHGKSLQSSNGALLPIRADDGASRIGNA
ncbi:RDD family protein [Burkholderia guangdongensis]|uniref:RDD family protein n=1 Tax=Burkholderia guangdongensis TaxID=1792500 RepID=UPI0015C827D4|nr:RDD family protein [Burkholderia guangdongensis]